jgi:hypothetical protein
MGIKDFFQSYNPDDLIYLTVVETSEGELPEGQLRMLLCDAKGILKVSDISADFYQGLADMIDEASGTDVSCAAVSISLDRDLSQSYVVEISAQQARALDAILHAVWDIKKIPPTYIGRLGEIIKLSRGRARKLVDVLATQPDGTYPGIFSITPTPYREEAHDHEHDHEHGLPPNVECPKCKSNELREISHREGESPEYECQICGRKFNWP